MCSVKHSYRKLTPAIKKSRLATNNPYGRTFIDLENLSHANVVRANAEGYIIEQNIVT